ncbi:MAG TPA: SCO family protein [Chitinophagaceae bacterium]
MNKKAFYAILIALVVPVGIFLYVNSLPKAAIPKPLFYDSVSAKIVKGKAINDTIWHHIPNFTLTNQLGKKVSFSDVSLSDSGKISVVQFFFTHCPSICPGMTMQMKKLQDVVQKGVRVGDNSADYVQFISFSIDPERDSVEALKKWADRFQINPDNWWLLTGDTQTIYTLSREHMNLQVMDPRVNLEFPHTDMFVLIDKHGVVRARKDQYGNPLLYHSNDDEAMSNLAKDIVLLSLEKDASTKGFLAGKLQLIIIIVLVVIIALGLFFFIFKKKKPDANSRVEQE